MRNRAAAGFRIKFLFHTPKPWQFDVLPRYHDPDKERLEARYQQIRAEMGVSDEAEAEGIRRSMNFREKVDESWSKTSFSKQYLYSNLRLLLILAALCCAFYIAYEYLEF